MTKLESYIRDVPDFPKKGIIFKDITPLLGAPAAFDEAVVLLAGPFEASGVEKVVAVESRGFIFGGALARHLGAGFVPLRKPGKLPHRTVRKTYQLEYGADALEIHADALARGAKVLMVDDLLATGGTMAAACDLVESLGGKIVGVTFVIELLFLHGREKLGGYNVHALIGVP
jgi:adenine phosphoribosyltransferase